MKNNKTPGHQWKQLRERAGLTQREVSDALGYSTPQFISNVERGRCRFPIQKLAKIRKLYRLSVEQTINMVVSEERQDLLKFFRR
ncbi:MAG TPA: helix-turn-helix transcriptional regulator [Verrucomicrobiae bacterium]|nr:helix-turn-helix transcriptional regulator [Verrucomicrobiae bacterium]